MNKNSKKENEKPVVEQIIEDMLQRLNDRPEFSEQIIHELNEISEKGNLTSTNKVIDAIKGD